MTLLFFVLCVHCFRHMLLIAYLLCISQSLSLQDGDYLLVEETHGYSAHAHSELANINVVESADTSAGSGESFIFDYDSDESNSGSE